LDGKIPLIVDGGQSQVGIESTVVDLTVSPLRVLRPGMVHAQAIAAVGFPVADGESPSNSKSLRSPGLLKKHYAPKAKLWVLNWRNETDLQSQIGHRPSATGNLFVIAHTHIPSGFPAANVSVIPHDAEAFARALYAELHRCDAAGATTIVVEAPPDAPAWAGIADRLRRAAA
jgi:L-threonylcarbamoyladenylate synthase